MKTAGWTACYAGMPIILTDWDEDTFEEPVR